MANKEHVKILRSGVRAWNQWRIDNPQIVPDLIDADLNDAYLYKADLSGANLTNAILTGADLASADLSRADLASADLTDAILTGAVLSGAILSGANLSGAVLTGANLSDIKASVFEYYGRDASEVAQWLTYLKDGKVDGSQYVGDCCCLIGTIAKIIGVNYETLEHDSSSPCERFLTSVKKGDTPMNHPVAQIFYDWGVEFLKEEATRLKNS